MDFRVFTLALLLWLQPFWVCADDQLERLAKLIYQNPSQAILKINTLEQEFATTEPSKQEALRLQLLKCQSLLQLGENQAAINLAQMGEAKAKKLSLDQAIPYFLNCQADAHLNYDTTQTAQALLDTAINLARRYQQPQALVDALRIRGQMDTDIDNFSSAIEDLRIAIDIYPDIRHQAQRWIAPPQAYLYAAMGNLLYATKDLSQAMYYANLALNTSDAKGKVRHELLRNAARIAFDNHERNYSDELEKQAKAMLPEINSSPLDLAYSYAILASLALDKGRIDSAEEYISISINTFKHQNKRIALMRATRLLAQIRFAQHQNEQALELMLTAIKQGEELKQYSDLDGFYGIVSDYYLAQEDFKQAHSFLVKRYQAARLANEAMNDSRIVQFRARLHQQEIQRISNEPSSSAHSILKVSEREWLYSTLFLVALALIAGSIWYFLNRQYNRTATAHADEPSQPPRQQVELALHSAKQGNYPLSLLLVKASHIRQIDLPVLVDQLQHKLREQDKLLRYSSDEIAILLPHTTATGAQRVSNQLAPTIQIWQGATKVNIGIAGMQQFDTLESLVKRASLNQLGTQKASESKTHYSPAR